MPCRVTCMAVRGSWNCPPHWSSIAADRPTRLRSRSSCFLSSSETAVPDTSLTRPVSSGCGCGGTSLLPHPVTEKGSALPASRFMMRYIVARSIELAKISGLHRTRTREFGDRRIKDFVSQAVCGDRAGSRLQDSQSFRKQAFGRYHGRLTLHAASSCARAHGTG